MQKIICVSILVLTCLTLSGCASLPPGAKPDPRDPWERVNRATYEFNDALDRTVAKPVAQTYVKVTPRFVRTGVSNFMDNLGYPVVMVNDLLQAKFVPFFSDIGRFVMNTTLGIGGLFDPASSAGLAKNNEDFGQTLGKWGSPPGPYLMLPLLGPSDVRDSIGLVGDEFANPRYYINNNTARYTIYGVKLLDTRARLLDTERVLEGVYDRYAFIRNAYLQRRQYLVTDGQSSGDQRKQEQQQLEEEQRILEESEGPDQQQQSKPPQQPQDQPRTP